MQSIHYNSVQRSRETFRSPLYKLTILLVVLFEGAKSNSLHYTRLHYARLHMFALQTLQ